MSAARRGVDNPGAWFARAAAILLVLLFLVLPLAEVYSEALRDGLAAVWQALIDPDAISALKLTLMIAAITVPINTIGGLAAAWCIGRFDFAGRSMPDDADRAAAFGVTGDFRSGLGLAVRRAGLAGAVPGGTWHSDRIRVSWPGAGDAVRHLSSGGRGSCCRCCRRWGWMRRRPPLRWAPPGSAYGGT